MAKWLREHGHEVFSVFEEAQGIDDDAVIRKALEGNWILITNDKDFGAKVYRDRILHAGVVLLRLEDERNQIKINTLAQVLDRYSDRLVNNFVIVTETQIRFAGI